MQTIHQLTDPFDEDMPTDKSKAMNEEIWVPISVYNRPYLVSNMGGIKRPSYRMVRADGIATTYRERILKPVARHDGRLQITVAKKCIQVAHLVAKAFIGDRPSNLVVSHKDGDCTNNHAKNLEYITQSRNMLNIADGLRRDNKTGIRGVYCYVSRGSRIWASVFNVDKLHFKCSSTDKEKVIQWRKNMELQYHADRSNQ